VRAIQACKEILANLHEETIIPDVCSATQNVFSDSQQQSKEHYDQLVTCEATKRKQFIWAG
jgi:hypothetical protein